jgi:hypothetical protein
LAEAGDALVGDDAKTRDEGATDDAVDGATDDAVDGATDDAVDGATDDVPDFFVEEILAGGEDAKALAVAGAEDEDDFVGELKAEAVNDVLAFGVKAVLADVAEEGSGVKVERSLPTDRGEDELRCEGVVGGVE